MSENSIARIPKRRKSRRSKNYIKGEVRTSYAIDLNAERTLEDLAFLQPIPVKAQITKLKELLKTEELEEDNVGKFIPEADSLYVEDVIKTDIYSSGIKALDELLTAKGFMSGEVIEICGKPSSGKSLLVHSIMSNIMDEHPEIEVLYFDSRIQSKIKTFDEFLKQQGRKDDEVDKMKSKVAYVNTQSMYQIVHALMQLFNPHKKCRVYNRVLDMSKIRLIVINLVTNPFYHISGNIAHVKKVTFDLHKTIHRLTKYYGVTFFITNLALHKLNVTESDKGDDSSSVESVRESENAHMENYKAALDEYWPEILDHRFIITEISSNCDTIGHVEVRRQITLIESRFEKPGKSIIVKIDETGIS